MSNRIKRKGCTSKRFRTKEEAIGMAVNSRKPGKLNPAHAFRCPFCKGWHLAPNKVQRMDRLFEAIEQQRKEQNAR